MESTRLSKIERLLQKELSDIFQKQTQAKHGIMISRPTSRRKCLRISGRIRKPSALISDSASGNRSARFLN